MVRTGTVQYCTGVVALALGEMGMAELPCLTAQTTGGSFPRLLHKRLPSKLSQRTPLTIKQECKSEDSTTTIRYRVTRQGKHRAAEETSGIPAVVERLF